MEKEKEEEEEKERKGKEKKRQSRVQEDEQTCPFSFSLARVAQIPGTVSFDLHHEQLHSWEIWFDWFQPEPTVLGAAGTLPRYLPIHNKASPASRWLTYLRRSLLEMEIA